MLFLPSLLLSRHDDLLVPELEAVQPSFFGGDDVLGGDVVAVVGGGVGV
jgi:hypothetical protein